MTDRLPSRSWISYLVVLVVLAVLPTVMAVGLPYYQRYVAVQEIKRLGGSVLTEPAGPQWLRDLLGGERMEGVGRVVAMALFGTPISDDGLKHLSGLTNLQELYLRDTQVSDDGVKMLLKALPKCEIELSVTACRTPAS